MFLRLRTLAYELKDDWLSIGIGAEKRRVKPPILASCSLNENCHLFGGLPFAAFLGTQIS